MRHASLLVLAAACGGPATPSTSIPNPPPASAAVPGLPPAYARLFVAGEKSFAAEVVTSSFGDHGPETEKTPGKVTCTISKVTRVKDAHVANLSCSGVEMIDGVSGTLVGTPTGLYRIDGTYDGRAPLSEKELVLPAEPKADRREWKDASGEEGFGHAVIVEPHAGGWCAMNVSWGGDEAGWQLCVRERDGLIGGHAFFAGGMTKDAFFGEVVRP